MTPTLNDFAEEHGTVDDPRENIQVGTPDDGHLYRESEIGDYYHGDEKIGRRTHQYYTLIPSGSVMIVLDASDDATERGWPHDVPLEPGVYLSGKDGISTTHPPAPVAVDDDFLTFAANAGLRAADKFPVEDIVAIKVGGGSLILATEQHGKTYQQVIYQGCDSHSGIAKTQPDLKYGFWYVREFGTPYSVYSQADVPRLEVSELDFPEGSDLLESACSA